MIERFQLAEFDSLARLYNGFAPDRYGVDGHLLEQKTVQSPVFDWGASGFSEGQAFVAVKKSAASLYRGPFRDAAHITALGCTDPMVLLDLMSDVKRCLRDRGISTLQFGTDSAHLFPGCPTDFPALRDFLIIGGFSEGSEVHDLERDLGDYENRAPVPDGDVFRSVTAEDLPALRTFFEREFSGRWQWDVFGKIEAEDDPSTVFGLFNGSECNGFALVQKDGCKLPIGGAVWKHDLGKNWGSLGPIGVSRAVRGRGSGNALLGKALEYLRDSGARRTIIDWTGLVEFYGKHGFEVTRSYRYMSLNLEQET